MILRSIITLIVAVGTVCACVFSPAPRGGDEAGVIMKLPTRVGPLVGTPRDPDKVEVAILPTDTQFAKMTYMTDAANSGDRDVAHVSVVLAGAESRSIHRPEVCLTGQGWSIDRAQVETIEIAPGRTLQVKDLSISGVFAGNDGKTDHRRAHYVYWFAGNGVTTASHVDRMILSTTDAVLHNINHRWAYSSILALVTEDQDPVESGERRRTDEQTRRLISFLIQKLVPQFQKDFQSKPPAT